MSQRRLPPLRPQTLQKCVCLARPVLIRTARNRDYITYGQLLSQMGGRPGRGAT